VPTYVDVLFSHAGKVRALPGFFEIGEDPLTLEGPDVRVYLYPRVVLLHHPGAKWWDFVNGERERVRERSRELARVFGADRLLYLADAAGVVGDGGDDDLAANEEFLRSRRGPPSLWDAPRPSKGKFREVWFSDPL
jgi:hypothetical protein